ncbi:MAG TPA: metal-sulfur cluster assembly factor, partial [Opitutaceae bacterium]|nr:metal-sulfur cluster assembly factor [Opitutaceae bacterium]
MNYVDDEVLMTEVRKAIGTVLDPEFGIPVDDLGLIYDLVLRDADVSIQMTLTTKHCPAGELIVSGVQAAVESVPGVRKVEVSLVWDPVWTPDML